RFPEVSDKLAAYFAAEKDVKFALAPALSTMIDDKPPEIPGYRIIEKIGPGGMGVVYKAHRISTNSIVALKIIRPDRLEGVSPDQRRKTIERFITEAQAAAQLEHDNLVKVYEVGEHAGRPFYAMRYVEGQSLREMLTVRSSRTPGEGSALLPSP